MRPGLRVALELLALLAVPALLLTRAHGAPLGPFSVDQAGHLWMGWHAAQESLLRTELLAYPDGLDLLPVLGGWLDVALVGLAEPLLGLTQAYNGVLALYLLVAGLGGWWLGRALGAPKGAWVAGLLLQLDGFVMVHLQGGRPEQVGLGFAAITAAACLSLLRTPKGAPLWRPALLGVAAAAIFYVSWELSLLTGLCALLTLPWALRASKHRAARLRAMGAAGLAAALFAGPWILLFVSRTSQVRSLDEGTFGLETAARASVGLLQWLQPGHARATWAALLCLLALPLTAPKPKRWLPVAGVLVVLLVLALGPGPGLWEPGAGRGGPFALLQGLPVLGWFHWPDRLLAAFSVAAVGAAAVAVQRCGRWAPALGILLVLGAAAERWPSLPIGGEPLRTHTTLAVLQTEPPGALLDLPIQPEPVNHLRYQMLQLEHGRPILFNMVLDHLKDGSVRRRVQEDPVLRWFESLMASTAPPSAPGWTPEDFQSLQRLGFSHLALHKEGWPVKRWLMARGALREALGPPLARDREDWMLWSLEAEGAL